VLNWRPSVEFPELLEEMVHTDIESEKARVAIG
jgi:hypothetical protein